LKLRFHQLQAVVGGLAISPSQIPVNCAGLHIIHVLEDKLCVWDPGMQTRNELSDRFGESYWHAISQGLPRQQTSQRASSKHST